MLLARSRSFVPIFVIVVSTLALAAVSVPSVAEAQTSRPGAAPAPSREVEITLDTALRDVTRQIDDAQAGVAADPATYVLGNASVVVSVPRLDGTLEQIETRSDAMGRISVPLGTRKTQTLFSLKVEAGDTSYLTRPRPLQDVMPESLQCYRVTHDRSDIKHTFFVRYEIDEANDRVLVRQVQGFANQGYSVFVGAEGKPSFSFFLPEGAEVIQLTVDQQTIANPRRATFDDLESGVPISRALFPATAQGQILQAIGDYWLPASATQGFSIPVRMDFPTDPFWIGYEVSSIHYPYKEAGEADRLIRSSQMPIEEGQIQIWKRNLVEAGTVVTLLGAAGEQKDLPPTPESQPKSSSAADPHAGHNHGPGDAVGDRIPIRLSLRILDGTRIFNAMSRNQPVPQDSLIQNQLVTIHTRDVTGAPDTISLMAGPDGSFSKDLGDRVVGDPVLVRFEREGVEYVSQPMEIRAMMAPEAICFVVQKTEPRLSSSLQLILTDETEYEETVPMTDGSFQESGGESQWEEEDIVPAFNPPEPDSDGSFLVKGRAVLSVVNNSPYVYEPAAGEVAAVMPCLPGASMTTLTVESRDVLEGEPRDVPGHGFGVPVPLDRIYPSSYYQYISQGSQRGISVSGTFEKRVTDQAELLFELRAPHPMNQVQLVLSVGRFHYEPSDHPKDRRFFEANKMKISKKDVAILNLGGVGPDTSVPIRVVYGSKPIHRKTQWVIGVLALGVLSALGLSIFMSARRKSLDPLSAAAVEMELLDQRLARKEITRDEYNERLQDVAGKIAAPGALPDPARVQLASFVERYSDSSDPELSPARLKIDLESLQRALGDRRGSSS